MVDSVTGGLVTVIRHDREANLVVIACRFGSVIATVTRFSLFDDDHDHAQKHDHGVHTITVKNRDALLR